METYHRGHLTLNVDLGTILGPDVYGQYVVVRECTHDTNKACLWSPTNEDFQAMLKQRAQSMTEFKLQGFKVKQ